MKQWSIGLMSNDEKRNILDQHKTLYDGYRTMQPQVSNTQPLYTQDFANDKVGVTVTNKGNVKRYTNMGINEQVKKESMCSECGGMVYEGECMECGYGGRGMGEEMGEETQQVKNLKKVYDIDKNNKFDYVEGEIDELSSSELKRGKKYKYKHPEFDDDLEYEDEFEDKHGGDTMYKFKSKDNTTHMMPNKSIEYFMGDLDEDGAFDADALQNLTGQEAPHMSDDMAPDGMDDDSDNDRKMMADGEMEETYQGNPYDNRERAYTFTSKGPKDSGDAYSIKADDMDLDDSEIERPFNFSSNGAVREFDQMESAFDDEDDDLAILDYNQDEEDDYDDNDSWEEITSDKDSLDIDDDIRESVNKQKGLILEMMNRMKGRN
jgi:hypothetical protein